MMSYSGYGHPGLARMSQIRTRSIHEMKGNGTISENVQHEHETLQQTGPDLFPSSDGSSMYEIERYGTIPEDVQHEHETPQQTDPNLEIKAERSGLFPKAIPQADGEEYAPGISYDTFLRLRTVVCGKITPSKVKPGCAPIQQSIRTVELRPFICPICLQGRNRSWHVEEHFPHCVETNGNPHGLHWFDHPSTLKHYREGGPRFTRSASDASENQFLETLGKTS
ncbi:hypothetical protein MMC07_002590 [Pseudocyphellaria aurata]|nr:hypothetical protein [Pseudocyphellaria aurata]